MHMLVILNLISNEDSFQNTFTDFRFGNFLQQIRTKNEPKIYLVQTNVKNAIQRIETASCNLTQWNMPLYCTNKSLLNKRKNNLVVIYCNLIYLTVTKYASFCCCNLSY